MVFGRSPRSLLARRQSFHKGGLFGALKTFLQLSGNSVFIARNQGADIEPESGKDAAANDTVGARLQFNIVPLLESIPMNLRIHDPPDKIFRHEAALVNSLLLVQIVRGTAHGDFRDEFWAAFQ